MDAINIQTDLMATFRQDFSKYAGHADKRCLNAVLSSVAQRTGEQIKYSKLDDNFTNPTIKKTFVLTEDKTGELPEKRIKFLPLFKAGAL